MPRQKRLGDGVERAPVLLTPEPVAFVGVVEIGDGDPALPHRGHDLLRLRDLHARIVRAVRDQERAHDPADVRERRALREETPPLLGRVIARPHLPDRLPRLPVGRDRLEQRDDVRDADVVDGARELLGREGQADERRIAAVASAEDRHALGIGDSLGDRPVDGVDQVVVHLAGPLEVGGVDERFAKARRAAEVHAEHGVASIGQPLMRRREAPGVASPRTTVHVEHQRARHPPRAVARQREIRHEREPVTGAYRDRFHRDERHRLECLLRREEHARSLGDAIVVDDPPRALVALVVDDPVLLVQRLLDPADIAVLLLGKPGEVVRVGRIQHVPATAREGDTRGEGAEAPRIERELVEISGGVFRQDAPRTALEILRDHGGRVAVARIEPVELGAVLAEVDRPRAHRIGHVDAGEE